MSGREQILDPPSRLETLDALTRAGEVAIREAQAPQTSHLAHNSMLEVVTAQRVMVQRDLPSFLQRIKTMASVAGEQYYYSFPVRTKNKETGQWEEAPPIEGPSIQLAQDLAREYGNCAVDTKVFDIGDRWVIYARFTDYERGFTQVRPYLQRKSQQSIGGKDRSRQEDAAFQIGVSKAIRNVIVKSLETFADMMFEQARSGLVAAVKAKLPSYKEKIARRLTELGVPLARVEPFVGKKIGDWNEFETTRIVVELKSVAEGMATVDELWPAPETFIDPNAKKEEGNAAPATGSNATSGATSDPGASGSGSSGNPQAPGDNAGASASGNDSAPSQGGSRDDSAGVSSSGPAADGNSGDPGKNAPSSGDVASGQGQPPADEELSPTLTLALGELLKMQSVETVQVLDEQAKANLSEADYAKFEAARDERLKTVIANEAKKGSKKK